MEFQWNFLWNFLCTKVTGEKTTTVHVLSRFKGFIKTFLPTFMLCASFSIMQATCNACSYLQLYCTVNQLLQATFHHLSVTIQHTRATWMGKLNCSSYIVKVYSRDQVHKSTDISHEEDKPPSCKQAFVVICIITGMHVRKKMTVCKEGRLGAG